MPQGSVFGHEIYMLPLGNVIKKHNVNFRCYSDNTHMYMAIKPEEADQFVKLKTCTNDIKPA